MRKIKATYRSCRGAAPCCRCPENPDKTDVIFAYGKQESLEEAEKLLYENLFYEELDLQNERYRKKGNYGRIKTMDEFRMSERHRPIENVLQVGNTRLCFSVEELWDVYKQFYRWRWETFGGIFAFVGAAVFAGCRVPHIHERYVLFWTDEYGVKHTGINKALMQAGVGLPFGGIGEGRYNNRKMVFDRICREKWLDIVSEKLKAYSNVELDRPDPEFKLRVIFGRDSKLEMGCCLALCHAADRNYRKMLKLKKNLADLQEKQEAVRGEIDTGDVTEDRMNEMREQMLIVKNKIKDYNKRLAKTQRKDRSFRDALNG